MATSRNDPHTADAVHLCEIRLRANRLRAARRAALLGSVASLVTSVDTAPLLAQGAGGYTPRAPATEGGGPMQLPTISVQGAETTPPSGYKADQSSLGKLTEPLLNTPFTVETVTRQLMDDQGVTTVREALRNVPGISLAAGEARSQGDGLTIRGFTARNDIFLDGVRDFGSYYRDPFYLQDIQVLKGPASICSGAARPAGSSSRTASCRPSTRSRTALWSLVPT